MTYSYDRVASAMGDVKSLSPKFYQALKKAVSEEKHPKVKASLKEALKHLEMVMDNLKAAEHEEDESIREASSDTNSKS